MPKRYTWLILILLAAASLRLVGLSEIPPGLTHDEADHGLDAWGVVNGIRPVYFTVGYGREPFFDYATAGLMAFLGPSYMAGRLTAVYLSLILIAGTYAWSRRAFGNTTALLTAAGLAVRPRPRARRHGVDRADRTPVSPWSPLRRAPERPACERGGPDLRLGRDD